MQVKTGSTSQHFALFKNRLIDCLPLVFFLGLSFVMTWPLVTRLGSWVVGWTGDNVYYVWLIGWFQQALFDLHINPLVVPFHNYPYGWPLAYSEITFSNVLLGLPFSLLGGPILGYNAVILLSFVLSGWFVYVWVFEITGSRAAGLVAGTIFAFAPYRLAHLQGHLPLMATQWLALHYYGLYCLLAKPESKVKSAVAAALGLGLASLSSMYYLYMSLVISALFVAGYLVLVNWRILIRRDFWRGTAVMVIITVPLVWAAVAPYLQLARGDANHRPIEEVDFYSASPTDFVVPSPKHFLYGKAIELRFPALEDKWEERNVYLGAVTLFLSAAAVGLALLRKYRRQKPVVFWLALMTAGALILAMGTTLHWMGQNVILSRVPWMFHRLGIITNGWIPLPNYFLYEYLPYYDGMRVWERYAVYGVLFAAVLAGSGFQLIAKQMPGRIAWMVLLPLCLLLVMFDFRIDLQLLELKPRAADLWLAGQNQSGAVAQFPIDFGEGNVEYVYGSTFHGKPLLGMFYGAYLPNNYESLLPVLNTFPSPESIHVLRERHVRYILVDLEKFDGWQEKWPQAQKLGLVERARLNGILILTLEDLPSSNQN